MKPIRIVYGTEDYLMEQARKRFLYEWNDGSGTDIQIFTKDSPLEKVIESMEGSSLFGVGGISLWQECPFLPIKKGGRSRSKLSKEETWFLDKLAQLAEGTAFLFITKGNIDTGCIFYKKLKPMADVVACNDITDKDVMPYVVDYLKGKGKRLTIPAERFLHELFQTWESIPLLYVFSELEKLCITLDDHKEGIEVSDLDSLFAGTMEKNLFTFVDAFMNRNGKKAIPLAAGLFAKQDLFLKNSGFMLSRLRLLRAYKELHRHTTNKNQIESVLTKIQKGRSAKYLMYHLQKQEDCWKLSEVDDLIRQIFTLQLAIRRGTATVEDMEPLICLYCK